jgi:RNA polymerase sigma factor (sigma-70 family)
MTTRAPNFQERLSDSKLRSFLLRHAKRSLPTADAEDLVQQALCDAVGARRQPEQDAEIAPWLMTILKRRICDWFRSPRVEHFEEGDLDRFDTATRGAGFDRAFDARDLLERVVAHATAPERQTLSWLVQEHNGDTLEQIAARDRCAGPVVRQRIHRFRQHLRARWLIAATLAIVLVWAVASRRGEAVIVRDDMALAPVILADVAGLYQVDEVSAGAGVSSADRALLDGIRVGRAQLRVSRPTGEDAIVVEVGAGVLLRVVDASDGRMRVRADDGSEQVVRAKRVINGGAGRTTLEVLCEEGRLRGTWLRLRPVSTE